MTVLFGSYATASSRAPPHAHEDTEESMNRLFENETANVQDHIGDKLVSDNFSLGQLCPQEEKNVFRIILLQCLQ